MYPWFAGGGFDPEFLDDRVTRNRFISWMTSGDGGDTIVDLVPDVLQAYDEGRGLGR